MVRMRLTTQDDYLHPVEEASNYNESRYYNFFDPGPGLGGWVRLGNRPNEGYAEMTTCLYLPDGRVAFMFDRPRIDGNDRHDAGGLRFEVVEPFAEHRVSYDGKVVVLAEPRDMEDPRAAFAENPIVECRVDLTHRALAPVWGGEPVADGEDGEDGAALELDPETAFARGHTEQHMAVTGTVSVENESFEVTAGLGLRDHSWGPRYWQNIWWYRWLTINLGRDLGLAATVISRDADSSEQHGFVFDRQRYGDDRLVPLRRVHLSSDYDEHDHHRRVRATATTDDATYEIEGEVWSSIPLRNRREGRTTRITEGMTTWRRGDQVGSGLSEYLDQIVDGRPVGVSTTPSPKRT
jgi:hypothetical protein